MEENKASTIKAKGETERQYTAWLLYYELGSLTKLLETWRNLDRLQESSRPRIDDLKDKLGSPPRALTTLKNWSKKFLWVERSEEKRKEVLEELEGQLKKIDEERIYLVAQVYKKIGDRLLKQLSSGGNVTVSDFKNAWEMIRTELGLSIGKQENINKNINMIDENLQTPPTPEEEVYGMKMDQLYIDMMDGKFKKEAEELARKRHAGIGMSEEKLLEITENNNLPPEN